MKQGKILIVDDNKSVLSALELLLQFEFEEVITTNSPNRIPELCRKHRFDLVLLDMNFKAGINTGNEGLFWLKELLKTDPDLIVIMITAYGDVELAVRAIKEGATDFVLKPWENEKLKASLKASLKLRQSRMEVNKLKNEKKELTRNLNADAKKIILGSSPPMVQLMKLINKVAVTDATILITGENGTGKELVAKEIHKLSARKEEAMITVDMGAVSETLFESELFGHVKGSFTDAREDRAGKMEAAHKGSLFLDEIGNLSMPLQAKLLSVLQNREIIRVGSNTPIPVDIRLICATNKDLHQMVEEGEFREDLLYRINTIHLEVPPLRERGEDIPTLAEFFLKTYADKYNKAGLEIDESGFRELSGYSWPGNVRELQHTIEKAVIMSDGKTLSAQDFILKSPTRAMVDSGNMTLEEMESQMIKEVLNKSQGNLSAAAAQLGITRQTLYNKIKKYGL